MGGLLQCVYENGPFSGHSINNYYIENTWNSSLTCTVPSEYHRLQDPLMISGRASYRAPLLHKIL